MIRLAYIASSSYSGSTLLTRLLNEHPAIATVGELKGGIVDPDVYQCSCGSTLSHCDFWQFVAAELYKKDLQLSWDYRPTDFRAVHSPVLDKIIRARVRGQSFESMRNNLLTLLPTARQTFGAVHAYNRAVVQAALDWFGGEVFLDASKDPVRLKYLIDSGEYQVFLIHLIRDGRGVAHSAIKNRNENLIDSACDWQKTNVEIERLRETVPNRSIQIRYEDLCENPGEVVNLIYAFLNLSQIETSHAAMAREHHILGNRMRLRTIASIANDESWRFGFEEPQQQLFDKIAGTMNRRYGYA